MRWDYSEVDTPTVYVDVDGTLLLWRERYGKGVPLINEPLVNSLRHQHEGGTMIYLWSRGGAKHAEMAADFCGIKRIVAGYMHKPQMMVDDDFRWLDAAFRVDPAKKTVLVA